MRNDREFRRLDRLRRAEATTTALVILAQRDKFPDLLPPIGIERARDAKDEWFKLAVLCEVIDHPTDSARVPFLAIVGFVHGQLHAAVRHVGADAFTCTTGAVIPVSPARMSWKSSQKIPDSGLW